MIRASTGALDGKIVFSRIHNDLKCGYDASEDKSDGGFARLA